MVKPNLEEEKSLLNAVIDGDIRAFETILKHYEKPIWNHLRRITGSEEDASDLLQETFLKLYSNRKNIDITCSFKNWLYRIATNTAYDLLRKKKYVIEIFINDDDGSETILPELAYSKKEEQEIAHDMDHALYQIPHHYRAILLLYYHEGFSYEEIAPMLALPINTVKTHIRRAKQALRKHLHHYG